MRHLPHCLSATVASAETHLGTPGLEVTLPVWVLLGFVLWTLQVLALTVGVHRWWTVLSGRGNFAAFAEYKIEGPGWYRRALRAHANCVENLPVFGGLALIALLAGMDLYVLDVLAVIFIAARIPHTIVHVAFEQTNGVTALRSVLFIVQWLAMVSMGGIIAWSAVGRI